VHALGTRRPPQGRRRAPCRVHLHLVARSVRVVGRLLAATVAASTQRRRPSRKETKDARASVLVANPARSLAISELVRASLCVRLSVCVCSRACRPERRAKVSKQVSRQFSSRPEMHGRACEKDLIDFRPFERGAVAAARHQRGAVLRGGPDLCARAPVSCRDATLWQDAHRALVNARRPLRLGRPHLEVGSCLELSETRADRLRTPRARWARRVQTNERRAAE
jgi:hypothetical protein